MPSISGSACFYRQTAERDLKVIWLDGPRVKSVFDRIEQRQIPIGRPGKGQGVWMALGYILSRRDLDVVALHDCDIVTYDRYLLGRLIEPVANPNNDFEFCKGYYARMSPTEKNIKGRVTRLFVLPFIDAMTDLMNELGRAGAGTILQLPQMLQVPPGRRVQYDDSSDPRDQYRLRLGDRGYHSISGLRSAQRQKDRAERPGLQLRAQTSGSFRRRREAGTAPVVDKIPWVRKVQLRRRGE